MDKTQADSVSVTKLEAVVLLAISDRGPLTWDEISYRTGSRPGAISPRFKPLRQKGLIEAVGRRPGTSGRSQIVWGLTELGREKMALWGAAAQYEPGTLKGVDFGAQPPSFVVYEGAPAITVEMIDAITNEQWDEITDGKGAAMRGFLRKRMKRAVRLLTEGRIYDTDADGRTLAARAGKG